MGSQLSKNVRVGFETLTLYLSYKGGGYFGKHSKRFNRV